MTRTRPSRAALFLAATLPAACLAWAGPLRAETGLDQKIKVEAGAAFFASECRRCHATDADRTSYGPLLDGVVGRPAGGFADYPYSAALAKAGFIWTEGALRAWMADNTGLVPGTKMRHVGITDPTVQDFIIAYLTSLGPAQ